MELTKENVYIYLRGKSKEELTELKNILVEFKQNTFRVHLISYYYENQNDYNYFHFVDTTWLADSDFHLVKEKTEVTIEQLKEILKPMETETLQEKEQRLLKELEEVRKEIEENNIKIGDWVKRTYRGIEIFKADHTHDYRYINSEQHIYQKITNPQLIELLEQEIK